MTTAQYPNDFPIDDIRKIVGFVKDGTIQNNIKDAAYSIWVVQGYAQRALIGQPNIISTNPDFSLQSVDVASILESLASDRPTAQMAIPWEIILPYLLQLLQTWLSSKIGTK